MFFKLESGYVFHFCYECLVNCDFIPAFAHAKMASSLGLALLAVAGAASESMHAMDAMRVAVLEHRVQKRLTGKRWGFHQQKMGI